MKIYRIAQERVFYRGSPQIEETPIPQNVGVFVSASPEYAANYGSIVNMYNGNSLNIWDFKDGQNKQAWRLVDTFFKRYGAQAIDTSTNPFPPPQSTLSIDDDAWTKAAIFLFPTKDWSDFVQSLGYDATTNDGLKRSSNICVFNVGKLKYLGVYHENI